MGSSYRSQSYEDLQALVKKHEETIADLRYQSREKKRNKPINPYIMWELIVLVAFVGWWVGIDSANLGDTIAFVIFAQIPPLLVRMAKTIDEMS